MAAQVRIVQKSFKNDAGEPVSYERLAIIGSIGGETHTLEIKLETGELIAAKMLLASDEKLDVHHVAGANGKVEVTQKPQQDPLEFLAD